MEQSVGKSKGLIVIPRRTTKKSWDTKTIFNVGSDNQLQMAE